MLSRFGPPLAFFCAIALCACASEIGPGGHSAAPPLPPTPPPGARVDGMQQAMFAEPPEALFAAAAMACDGPGQALYRPDLSQLQCESLPTPENAAGLILRYDGTVEDLPRYVISFRRLPLDGGWLVSTENFIRIPQRDSFEPLFIRLDDPLISEAFRNMLVTAGGRLITR